VPGSKSWDAAITRIATWGIFRDRASGDRIFVLNTHFDHIGVEAREQSARLIVDRLRGLSRGLPVVVMGDFNATDDAAPYAVMTGELRDAFYASRHGHHGPTSTWNGFDAIEPGRRIDYIFVDERLGVLQHGILSDTFDGRFPSDHLPVLAEIDLP
jgi:endonuclease/exonuclease/phosphatase family metal-dependent hydrolase